MLEKYKGNHQKGGDTDFSSEADNVDPKLEIERITRILEEADENPSLHADKDLNFLSRKLATLKMSQE
jgi:hypothetical protein